MYEHRSLTPAEYTRSYCHLALLVSVQSEGMVNGGLG